jgi:hypothetical protein
METNNRASVVPEMRTKRFWQAAAAAGKLMQLGLLVFSPISHTHPIAVGCELPTGWDYWRKYDQPSSCGTTEKPN